MNWKNADRWENSEWKFKELLFNHESRIISKEAFKSGISLPKPIANFLDGLSWSIHKPKHSYCPYCLSELPAIYVKREWEFQWNTHCIKHKVRLTDRCIHCGALAEIFNRNMSLGTNEWRDPWGVCYCCDKPLSADPSNAHALNTQETECILYHINKTNKLIEGVRKGDTPFFKVSMVLNIADIFISCQPHDIHDLYTLLLRHDMDLLESLFKGSEKLEPNVGAITNIPPEFALQVAWHIAESRMDIFDIFLTEKWLTRISNSKTRRGLKR